MSFTCRVFGGSYPIDVQDVPMHGSAATSGSSSAPSSAPQQFFNQKDAAKLHKELEETYSAAVSVYESAKAGISTLGAPWSTITSEQGVSGRVPLGK